MIDEKKIEEAATKYAGKRPKDLLTMERQAFIDGAQWVQQEFIKDLWHGAKKKPREWEDCLVELETYRNTCRTSYNRTATRYAVAYMRCSQWDESNFPTQNYDIRRWCYVKDLLPDGEKD